MFKRGGIMRRANVKVVEETSTGLNRKVSINGEVMTNNQAYKKAVAGEIPGYTGVNNNGTKYIRSNADGNPKNNLG